MLPNAMRDVITELDNRVSSLEIKLNTKIGEEPKQISKAKSEKDSTPHRCPICFGDGREYIEILSSPDDIAYAKKDDRGRMYIECLPCKGWGIVWSHAA